MARVTSLIMRSSTSSKSAFTLIEMLTVMAVIAILASLIVGIQAFAQKKAALTRASGEMQTMATACQAYKADEGGFPRDIKGENSDTDALDPRVDGDPTNLKYQKASLYLYKKLTGDENATGKKGDGKSYCEFIPSQLQKDASGAVKFIRDPFGNSYGYSTAGATMEETYRQNLEKNPATERPSGTELKGFNPTFDIWSTGGVVSKTGGTGGTGLNAERKRWVKNW